MEQRSDTFRSLGWARRNDERDLSAPVLQVLIRKQSVAIADGLSCRFPHFPSFAENLSLDSISPRVTPVPLRAHRKSRTSLLPLQP